MSAFKHPLTKILLLYHKYRNTTISFFCQYVYTMVSFNLLNFSSTTAFEHLLTKSLSLFHKWKNTIYPSLVNMSTQWFLLWCVLKLIFLELIQEEHAIRLIGTRTVRTNVNIIDGICFEKIPKDPQQIIIHFNSGFCDVQINC